MLTSILVFGNDIISASVSIKMQVNMYGSSLVYGYDLQSVGQLQNVQSDRHYHYKLQVETESVSTWQTESANIKPFILVTKMCQQKVRA